MALQDKLANFLRGTAKGAYNEIVKPYGQLLSSAALGLGAEGALRLGQFNPLPDRVQSGLNQAAQNLSQEALRLREEQGTTGSLSQGLMPSLRTTAAGASATGRAMLGAYGVTAGAPVLAGTAATGGVLSGGMAALQGQDPWEAAGYGVGSSPLYAGLGRLTSPIINPTVNRIAGTNKGIVPLVTRAAATGGANVLEDEAFTRLIEQRAPTTNERLFSFGIGALTSPLQGNVYEEPTSATKRRLVPEIDGQPRTPQGRYDKKPVRFLSDMLPGREIRETASGGIDRRTGQRTRFIGDARQEAGLPRYGEAAGAIAGVELYQDENGETKVRFNPENALLGIGLAAGVTKAKATTGKADPSGFITKFDSGTSASANKNAQSGLSDAKSIEKRINSILDVARKRMSKVDDANLRLKPAEVDYLYKDERALLEKLKAELPRTSQAEAAERIRLKREAFKKSNLPPQPKAPQGFTQAGDMGGRKTGSSLKDPTIPNEYQKLNVNKLNLDPEQKANVRSLESDEPRVVLKNSEVVKMSDLTEGKSTAVDINNTKRKLAQQLNSRQKVVSLEQELAQLRESGAKPEVLQQKIEEIAKQSRIARTEGTEAGRQLQARNILADAMATPMQKVFRLLDNAGIKQSEYTGDAAKVNWNNAEEVVNFYRRYVPPTASDWIDTLRYNSMLSSPNTHIINAFSGLLNTTITAPLEMAITGGVDFLSSKVRGRQQTRFVAEAPAYMRGYVSSAGDAANNFWQTLKGRNSLKNLDLDYMPLGTEGRTGKILKAYSTPTRALEAVDQFFTTLAKGGEREAINVRTGRGVKIDDPESLASRRAAYRLFRGELKEADQGTVLNAIDEVTALIQRARNNDNPIVSTVAKFTLPFVRTPMNIIKQGVEYSPLGITTIPGSKNKSEQLSKALLGTAGITATAMLAANGSLSWSEPTDEKKKQAFRDAGMQPYSIKIGDKWVAYNKLPPAMSFPIAMVAALHDAQRNKTIDQTQFDAVLSAVAKSNKFYADQSYLKSIGDLVATLSGDTDSAAYMVGNYPQQLIPWRAFMGWAARLADPYQRQVDRDGSLLAQQTELMLQQIPILSQTTNARKNEFDEPILNRDRGINAVSPVRVSTEDPEKAAYYNELQEQTRLNRNIKAAEKMIQRGEEVPEELFSVKAADQDEKFDSQKSKLLDSKKEEIIKKKIQTGMSVTGKELEQAYLKEFESLPTNNNYQKGLKDDKRYDLFSTIQSDEYLTDEQKGYLTEKLGIKKQDAEYYEVAKQEEDIKYGYIQDLLAKSTDEDILTQLAEYRKPVNGKQILSDGVIDQLYYDEVITSAQRKALKAIKYDKLGKLRVDGGGSGKKLKIDFTKLIKTVNQTSSVKITAPQLTALRTPTARSLSSRSLGEFKYKGKEFSLKR
jgi:hypothetical protein